MMMRWWALLLASGVFAADMASKAIVKNTFWLHYYPVIEGFFTIQYSRNEGIAFGIFHDFDSAWKLPVLSAVAVLAILLVLYYLWTTPPSEKLVFVALGLLLGGILGNFVDRLMHESVVDFLKFHYHSDFAWPTFNIADSAITSGVILIFLSSFLTSRDGQPSTSNESSIVAD